MIVVACKFNSIFILLLHRLQPNFCRRIKIEKYLSDIPSDDSLLYLTHSDSPCALWNRTSTNKEKSCSPKYFCAIHSELVCSLCVNQVLLKL